MAAALSLAIWCGGSARAGDARVDRQAWFSNGAGSAQDQAVLPGDPVSLRGDLAVRSENIPEVRASWDFGHRSRWRRSFANDGGQGSNVATRAFNDSGTPFVVGEFVNTNDNVWRETLG